MRKKGNLLKGAPLETGGKLYVDIFEKGEELPSVLERDKADNVILSVALQWRKDHKNKTIVFVTKDINLRVKADLLGLQAEDYEPQDNIVVGETYKGHRIVVCDKKTIDTFYKEKKLDPKKIEGAGKLLANEYIILKNAVNDSQTALARFDKEADALVPLIVSSSDGLWGVFSRNAEQLFAMDMLLNDKIKLVSLVGKAGTGKTLLALAAGLFLTIDKGLYRRLLVSRPIFPLGKDIGFLPGDLNEKLNPWMTPIFDNLDYILDSGDTKYEMGFSSDTQGQKKWKELVDQGYLNIEALTYIRGRSIANQFLIVDEAQNLTPHEIKTILTRAGTGTKVVLTGDRFQIDNPYIDASSNGLSYVVEKFKHEKIAGHTTLVKGERSELAEISANLL